MGRYAPYRAGYKIQKCNVTVAERETRNQEPSEAKGPVTTFDPDPTRCSLTFNKHLTYRYMYAAL